MSRYPTWRYHKTEGARLVKSEAEDASLGFEWVNCPSKFPQVELEKIQRAQAVKPQDTKIGELVKAPVVQTTSIPAPKKRGRQAKRLSEVSKS